MINNRYSIIKKSGEGHSQVFCCSDKYHPGVKFAIKILPKTAARKEESLLMDEYHTLLRLNHPNIIKAAGQGAILKCSGNEPELYNIDYGSRFIVMEYFDGEIITAPEWVRSEENLRSIILQLTSVLFYLHHSNYVYNDLKAENILINYQGISPVIKFIDFGFSLNIAERKDSSAAGTLHYLAPEIIKGGKSNFQSDLFSLGVLLYKIVYNRFPFEGNSDSEILKSIIENEPEYPESICNDFIKNITKKLLSKNIDVRYSSSVEVLDELDKDYKCQLLKRWIPAKAEVKREENSLISSYLKDVSSYEVLLLTGSEGSGKTTLLSSISKENPEVIYIGPNENLISGKQLIEEIVYNPTVFYKLSTNTLEEATSFLNKGKTTDQDTLYELKLLLIKICSEISLSIIFDDFSSYDTYTMISLSEVIMIMQSKRSKVILSDIFCSRFVSENIHNVTNACLQPFNNEQIKELIKYSLPDIYPVDDISNILSEYYGLTPGYIYSFLKNLYNNDIFEFSDGKVAIKGLYEGFDSLISEQNENYRRSFLELSAKEKKLVEFCSMLGVNIEADMCAEYLKLPQEEISGLINQLEYKGILKMQPNVQGLTINSEKFKSYIYSLTENKAEEHKNIAYFFEAEGTRINQEEIARQYEYCGDFEKSFDILWSRILSADSKDLLKYQKEILLRISEFPVGKEKLVKSRVQLLRVLQKLGEYSLSLDLIKKYYNDDSAYCTSVELNVLEGIGLVETGDPETGKQKLITLICKLKDDEVRLSALLYLAFAEFDLGQFEDASGKCNELIGISEKYPEISGKAYNLSGLIDLYYRNDLSCAIQKFEASLGIYKKAQLQMQVAAAEVNIGNIYNMRGNYEAAEMHWRNSLSINSSIGNMDQEAKVLLNLGILSYDKSDSLGAINQYKEAQFIFSNLGSRLSEGLTYSNLGEAYLSISEYTNSYKSLIKAKEIFSDIKNVTELIETEFLLGKFYFQLGDKKSIGLVIEDLNTLIGSNASNEKHNEYLRYLVLLERILKSNIDESLDQMKSIKEAFYSFSNRNDFLSISLLLSELYIRAGQFTEAIAELEDKRFEELSTFNIYVKAERDVLLSRITSETRETGLKNKFEYLNNAYSLVEEQNISEITWKVLYFMAVNFFERGNLNKAGTFSNYAKRVLLYISSQIEDQEMMQIYLSSDERYSSLQRLNNIQEHI